MAKEKIKPGYIEELDISYREPTLKDFSKFQTIAFGLTEEERNDEALIYVLLLQLIGDKEINTEEFMAKQSWSTIKILRGHLSNFLSQLA